MRIETLTKSFCSMMPTSPEIDGATLPGVGGVGPMLEEVSVTTTSPAT